MVLFGSSKLSGMVGFDFGVSESTSFTVSSNGWGGGDGGGGARLDLVERGGGVDLFELTQQPI